MIHKKRVRIQRWMIFWLLIYGSISLLSFFFHEELLSWVNQISENYLPFLNQAETSSDPFWVGSTSLFYLILSFICGQILYNIDSQTTLLALTKTLLTAQFFSLSIYFSLFFLSDYSNFCLLAIILHSLMFLITYTIRFEVKKES